MKLMTDKVYVVAKGKYTKKCFVFDSASFFYIHYEAYDPILYTDDVRIANHLKHKLNNLRA